MQNLDIHLLRSFIAVSRNKSIKITADQVGRTQSAVSMQMQRLEGVVGKPILYRTRYGIALTATGEKLLLHAKNILEQHDHALTNITGKGIHGQITIGCPEESLTAFFPDLLRSFAALHPGVEIDITSAPTTKLKQLLRHHKVDIALISLPIEVDADNIIYRENFVWVADKADPEALKRTVIPLALSAPDNIDHRAAITAIEETGLLYRAAFASNSFAGLLAITRSGQAISVISKSAVPKDLFIIEKQLPALPEFGIHLQYSSQQPSLIAKLFGEFAKNHLINRNQNKEELN